MEYCRQCKEPILPGDAINHCIPRLHEECYPLWAEDEDRRNFWFEYVMPEDYRAETIDTARDLPIRGDERHDSRLRD